MNITPRLTSCPVDRIPDANGTDNPFAGLLMNFLHLAFIKPTDLNRWMTRHDVDCEVEAWSCHLQDYVMGLLSEPLGITKETMTDELMVLLEYVLRVNKAIRANEVGITDDDCILMSIALWVGKNPDYKLARVWKHVLVNSIADRYEELGDLTPPMLESLLALRQVVLSNELYKLDSIRHFLIGNTPDESIDKVLDVTCQVLKSA